MIGENQRVVVAMMDGLDMAYIENTELPNFEQMAREGFFKEVGGVFPSVTNVNNVSVACGAWPADHGITANSYYDEKTNCPMYMNAAELILYPTIFARAAKLGFHSVLLTSKRKTLELFNRDVAIGIAAEDPQPEHILKYGHPPQIYSREINYWLWQVAIDLLKNRSDISLIYVHITDYPMHAWAPEDKESQAHLTQLDLLLGEARKVAPDAAFLITADHGMNNKKRCWDLNRVLTEAGIPPKFVLSPERDYYVKHHRNFTGCAWIWLRRASDWNPTVKVLQHVEGVEEIISREAAVQRFHLVPERIGDITVTGDKDTMFGDMETAYEDLPATYRAHGSLYEMRLPLLIWNQKGVLPPPEAFQANLDLTRFLYR
jgi:phosphonoacetate hydrolase